jgi:hypothetical protein
MAIIASGERGMGVPKHKECSGPGTDAVQEETRELDHYPIIDIKFHEEPAVQNSTFAGSAGFYVQAGLSVSRSARSGLAARPWLGVKREF